MLSVEENRILTQVGKGTPMGELLRRYWFPIAGSVELEEHPTKPVRLLGEDLVLYRDRSGTLGLIGKACPHRRVDMVYGFPDAEGLRCAYHGWLFDEAGRCLDMPAEPAESTFKDRVTIQAYPVQELGGMVFAYLGPEPAPLLPRYRQLVADNMVRDIGYSILPANWVQVMENNVDQTHTEWLHGHYFHFVRERRAAVGPRALGVDPAIYAREAARNGGRYPEDRHGSAAPRVAGKVEDGPLNWAHVKLGWDLTDYGIVKRRVIRGQTEEHPQWAVGHPLVFPHMVKGAASNGISQWQWRVPIDDTHTMEVFYTHFEPPTGVTVPKQETIPWYEVPMLDERGWHITETVTQQDMMAMVTQGEGTGILDRSIEKLGESDRGLILYRKLLKEQMQVVQDGGDPLNVYRDPAKNEVIDIPFESYPLTTRSGGYPRNSNRSRYSPNIDWLEQVYEDAKRQLAALEATAVAEPAGTPALAPR
jgi:5,5'-dehydrodivanillate O-demethylase